jgi:3-deoxy-D-manno-octulosonate 8-phosphate phosphatase (KDO 8-P phosphatase)
MTVEEHFKQIGGEFLLPFNIFSERLNKVKVFLFDWDCVFNDGIKSGAGGSPFSEADSMGINLLRFGYYLTHGKLPHTGIITGENNASAFHLANREHFDTVHFKFKHKVEALEHLAKHYNVSGEEVAFVFDDVLDVALAKVVALRLMVRRDASPLFAEYARSKGICDYVTVHAGKDHAVREVCELMIGTAYDYEKVVDSRVAFAQDYQSYLSERSKVATRFFKNEGGDVLELPFESVTQ